ncbi:sensor histidine kinase [Psychroflexus sediminis]|uniref:Histidine kinase n=1 Tax=Psychroflexus sediminis TaxID=470826 RepID=A0A1G7W7U7_9FLAO|nr:histidine kinase [Psychroflexus sediminis]SDG67869.1 Histidine kinase [Psychroflexus sediminis]
MSKKGQSKISSFFRIIGIALLTTVLLNAIILLVHYGSLLYDHEGQLIYKQIIPQEILLTFLFLLSLFWSHSKISDYFNSSIFLERKPVHKAIIEILTVVLISLLLLHLVLFIPFNLLYPDVDPIPEQLRTAYVLTCFFSLFFYFFVEREKSQKIFQAELIRSAQLQKENFQAQLQHLKNQVNPHFLFNSLNVLGSLIKKDRAQAVVFVNRLSDVYRAFLDFSDQQLIPLEKELELTKAYIYLLSTRFGSNIRFDIDVESKYLSCQLPPGSLQMLVENAVKHNASTIRNPLIISVFTEHQKLVVHNNIRPRKEGVKSTGSGLVNIKKRYRFLSNQEVELKENSSEFTVKLPLLKAEKQ